MSETTLEPSVLKTRGLRSALKSYLSYRMLGWMGAVPLIEGKENWGSAH